MNNLLSQRSLNQDGVTFLELLVTIAILGILAAIAVPYYGDYIERQRWVGAAEAVYSKMQHAKRLAISNNKTVYFIAASDADPSAWCLTYSEEATSNCSNAFVVSSSANPSLSSSGEDYPNQTVTSSVGDWPAVIGFSMPGLGVSGASGIEIYSARLDSTITVSASSAMNISICSDDYVRYDCD